MKSIVLFCWRLPVDLLPVAAPLTVTRGKKTLVRQRAAKGQ